MYGTMKSIKTSIILITVAIICSGFIAFEIHDFSLTKESALQELEERVTIKADRLAENLELPLWEVDSGWVEKVVGSEMEDKRTYAVIVETDGKLFVGKQRDSAGQLVDSSNQIKGDYLMRSRTVSHKGENIGSFKVYVTTQFMMEMLQQRLLRELITMALIALLLVVILVTSLNRLVVTRLQNILQSTRAIASGDYAIDLEIHRRDEIGMLAESINSMKQSIQEREQDLHQSRALLTAIVENMPAMVFLKRASDLKFELFNAAGEKLLGYDRGDLIGKNDCDFFDKEQADFFTARDREVLESHSVLEIPFELITTSSGAEKLLQTFKVGLYDADGQPTHLLGISVDITEKKQMESKAMMLMQAIEQAGEAIAITDIDGVIEHINPAFTALTGFDESEAIGSKTSILKSGSQDKLFYERLWETITYGQVWQGKVINRKKSGECYPAMLTVSPIRDEKGKTSHYIGTQQNLEEFEKLEAQFHQSQKMEAIGTLVGGIAHDFNNSLAGITGNLYLAKKAAADLPEVLTRLDSVEKLSFGAAAMIQQLLAFSRKSVVQMNPLSISSFLKETIKLQQASLPENINLQMNISDTEMQVKGDINQLQQVLMNLINNAYDAVQSSENPSILIRLDRYKADAAFFERHEGLEPKAYACISVIDNGSGIKPEHRDHIFEPFFTTKEPGKGTGLGLAMVYGAIETHGGVIEIHSMEKGQPGTTVQLFLPLIDPGQLADSTSIKDQVVEGRGETILLVDDNETVLETGRDVLEGLGYRVLTAQDGVDAVALYTERQHEIDLVILDVVMPRLGGADAMKRMRELNPHMKAMFATGYDRLSTLGKDRSAISEKVISKPFAISELSQTVRQMLDGA